MKIKNSIKADIFEQLLEKNGAEFDYRFLEYGQGMASTKDHHFRYGNDEVQIALRSNFDRWANSVDFVCRLPADQEDFLAMIGAMEKAVRQSRCSWEGSFDLWPLVRQYRRETRNSDRIFKKVMAKNAPNHLFA